MQVSSLPDGPARAYLNHSRWIADCPAGCYGAELLKPGQGWFRCSNCGHMGPVEWPPDPEGIWLAVAGRRLAMNRNWFPQDHRLAVAAGVPHGQTVAQLREETEAHEGIAS